MGYSDFGNFKLLDGYSFTATDGYAIHTNWVDIHSAPYFDVTIVFTGGSPAGTVKLQKSDNLQNTGGNRPQPNMAGNGNSVDDTIDVPTDATAGTVSVAISGAGTYELHQRFAGYRWFRLAYTPSASGATQLDVFVNWKK